VTTTNVQVVVLAESVSDAGGDKKILKGRNTFLSGTATGDGIRYFWTPAAGLDNPNTLTPRASPSVTTTYTLHVVSDAGCVEAMDEVLVTVYNRVIVPNAFSPNGDSVNDEWKITAIDAFEIPEVKVMNRYGELLFESKGYLQAWDGKFKGTNLPAGVYFYLIRLSDDLEPLTGAVTIIR
jgi:gliding motility-associated-like protein